VLEDPLSPDLTHSTAAGSAPGPDLITRWFLIAVALVGVLYAGFELTPSSYGVVLDQLGAPELGPVAGTARPMRSDEWSILTPYFQAAVRNRFQRVNEISFYREDLRNYEALPLADWGLIFKPQMWAFFLVSPAMAMSIFYALLMCAFLAGFHLLFRRLGAPSALAAAAAVMIYFSGFCQFWLTTFLPLFAGFPWIVLLVLRPMTWWKKALLCTWAFPVFVLSHAYPSMLLTLAWGALILILAFKPSLLRSPGDIAASSVGILAALVVTYAYFIDVIPIMTNTIYPGHRIGPPGTTPYFVALSEIFPFLTFQLDSFHNFIGENICEIGAVGSFLPLLTLCLTRYRALLKNRATRNALTVLLTGFIAITLWEIAPVPTWIGRILLWDTSLSTRWLFTSGFLLTLASVLIWSKKLISLHPFRLALFLLVGPIAGCLFKIGWMVHEGVSFDAAISICLADILLSGFALVAFHVSWLFPAGARAPLMLSTLALMNVYAFGKYNPMQPAGPIFQTPNTPIVQELRKVAGASPNGVVADSRFFGATLSGMGFRSVNHFLLAPKLADLRGYFPTMDKERFNEIFNRSAHIHLTEEPLPRVRYPYWIEAPLEAFLPVRSVRRLELGPKQRNACRQRSDGGIVQSLADHNKLMIEGWAPWKSETADQGIRVSSARALEPGSLSTITRPDIAERLQDYRFVKAGFKLQVSSADGKPLRPDEVALFAFGTANGETRLACCACP
jgi:hypothetical protein